jgi:hypothetical protein
LRSEDSRTAVEQHDDDDDDDVPPTITKTVKVWKEKARSRYEYSGEWQKNQFHGHGELISYDDELFPHGIISFEGTFANGLRAGAGTLKYIFDDGTQEVYTGQFKGGCYSGLGTLTCIDGSVYVGQWKRSLQHGDGEVLFPNLALGLMQVKSARNNHKKDNIQKYKGQWENGKPHGTGVVTYYNGDIYRGDLRKGYLHGRGQVFFAAGGGSASFRDIWLKLFNADFHSETGTGFMGEHTYIYNDGPKEYDSLSSFFRAHLPLLSFTFLPSYLFLCSLLFVLPSFLYTFLP